MCVYTHVYILAHFRIPGKIPRGTSRYRGVHQGTSSTRPEMCTSKKNTCYST
jgi:hypothetical protein